jgi:diguanylate cyclase (GGDEF)-like protein
MNDLSNEQISADVKTYQETQEFKVTKQLGEMAMDLYDSQNQLHEAQQLAEVDPLTRIPNRRGFENSLSQLFALAKRSKLPLSIAYVDADELKHMNDFHGHAAGDEMLKTIAKILKLRESDIVARLGEGSDEFAIILTDTNTNEIDKNGVTTADKLTQRLRNHAAENPFSFQSQSDKQMHQAVANFSIGFATLLPDDSDFQTMVNRAELEMKKNKNQRKQHEPDLHIRN